MRGRLQIRIAGPLPASMVIAAMLVSGCTSTVVGAPVADHDDSSTTAIGTTAEPITTTPDDAGVDPSDLDTGFFRITPQPDFGTVFDGAEGREVEGRRMADALVLPSEVDNELTALMPGSEISYDDSGPSLGLLLDEAAAAAGEIDLIAGAATSRTAPNTAEASGGVNAKTLTVAVLRYSDPDAAQRAAEGMHASLIRPNYSGFAYTPSSIEDLPDTLVGSAVTVDGAVALTAAFTAQGPFVIYAQTTTPVDRQSWSAPTISRFVELQVPLISRMRPTDEDALADLPIDEDHVLVLTVQDVDPNVGNPTAVYGPRAATHNSDTVELLGYLEQTGTDRVAVDGSTVYRAADANAASVLYALLRQDAVHRGHVEVAPPPNVPDSTCYTTTETIGSATLCLVHRDRYVGEVSGFNSKLEVYQATAAQYLILGI